MRTSRECLAIGIRLADSLSMRRPGPAPALVLVWTAVVAAGCGTTTAAIRPSPFPGSAIRHEALPPAAMAPAIVDRALSLRGTPYRLGGETPEIGLDCSGLVRYVFAAAGIRVPRTVVEQYAAGSNVDFSDLQPADLLFFDTSDPGPSHVGIAIDAETFVHAPGSGGVVRIERLATRYWTERLRAIKRLTVLP